MNKLLVRQTLAVLTIACLLTGVPRRVSQAQDNADAALDWKRADGVRYSKSKARGAKEPEEKLAFELRLLNRRSVAGGDGEQGAPQLLAQDLAKRFGVAAGQPNPSVEVAITTTREASLDNLKRAGATVRLRAGILVYASVALADLLQVAADPSVISIAPIPAPYVPKTPEGQGQPEITTGLSRGAARGGPLANVFDAQGLTGKGVIVGVVDSGIDWQHPDFIKEDGTSRILYLWDMLDQSWAKSAGRIGSKPPLEYKGAPIGTIYAREQINSALRGQGEVNSRDQVGHGTASAGAAAGNGRATANGVAAGTYAGVAPEADLIIVKGGDEGMNPAYLYAVKWIIDTAKARHQPCVINLSFTSHLSAHEGSDPEEIALDSLAGPGKPGVVLCVAAGNERRDSFHASGRFGPDRPEQADRVSRQIELFVSQPTILTAYFDAADDWGLAIRGLDHFFVGENGHPAEAFFFREGDGYGARFSSRIKQPENLRLYAEKAVDAATVSEKTHRLGVMLPPGKYLVAGFGKSEKVTNGRFDLYVPNTGAASFGKGADARTLIGTPGGASYAITVGAYDFRDSWENGAGRRTNYNLTLGDLADYSSPGFRRDGAVKPDIVAPATFAISALAQGSRMGLDGKGQPDSKMITRDGYHIAWNGTSAAAPHVAGVAALMLQKNPSLDAVRVREILRKTASKDQFTGAAPNPEWGFGKINASAALRATPVKGSVSRTGRAKKLKR